MNAASWDLCAFLGLQDCPKTRSPLLVQRISDHGCDLKQCCSIALFPVHHRANSRPVKESNTHSSQGAFLCIKLLPCSSYSAFDIHICWNEPSDARMEPPAVRSQGLSSCSFYCMIQGISVKAVCHGLHTLEEDTLQVCAVFIE